ncbi:hypothetical protein ACMA1D_02170 [Streptomyces sp. 796.1]|uniref:hypothetical protein n=1 Tax=Streptomyces sp. 796.1 TaxID=3163029 RepID=UPI0039C99C6C
MTFLALISLLLGGWLAVCWAVGARADRRPRPVTDPVADSRAAASAARAAARHDIPGGTR